MEEERRASRMKEMIEEAHSRVEVNRTLDDDVAASIVVQLNGRGTSATDL